MRLTEKEYEELCRKRNLKYIPPKNKTLSNSILPQTTKDAPKSKKKGNTKHSDFDSLAEENYYNFYIKPKLMSGEFLSCEIHKKFIILNAIPEYHFGNREYTPDFYITRADNSILVVEMKGKVIKKLQRDYPLRKHLFVEKFCIPNGWEFIEENSEQWTQNINIS